MLPDDENFDILGWWKANGLKYPIMQKIARDFLAIPISTVASKSSFSTSGRILTPHCSKLRLDTLEELMCVQDWLWSDMKGNQFYNKFLIFLSMLIDTYYLFNRPVMNCGGYDGIFIEHLRDSVN